MRFSELSTYLKKLEDTPSRLGMTEILSELLKATDSTETEIVINLALGQLAPSYKEKVFNLAEKMMIMSLSKAYHKDKEDIQKLYKEHGDLGNVAYILSNKNTCNLDVSVVYEELVKIASDEGGGSQERKIDRMAALISNIDKLSARFITRIPLGKLRLGFSDKTVIDALSWMECGDKSATKELTRVYQVLPDVALLAKRVKTMGISKSIKNIKPEVGVPVLPMLAQRLKNPEEMIDKMQLVSVEPKIDGLRVLIHFKGGKDGFVKAYTRNMNEVSWMFPELKDLSLYVKAKSLILDSEAVGLDEKSKSMANFQTTMTRRRKHDIEKYEKSTPIQFCVFDVLSKDEKNLMQEGYIGRRNVLKETVVYGKLFAEVDYEITSDPKRIGEIYHEKDRLGYEGIMIKKVDSGYIPGRTGWRWVKMKEDEMSKAKLSDTVDCLVMGYSVGKGKRASFGLGQFLVGVINKDNFQTITKVGTGLTDEQFRSMQKLLNKIRSDEKPKEYQVHKNYIPDYWVLPEVVVELAADEITRSPTHTSGFALRFPRLVKIRTDKSKSEITSLEEIKKLFKLQ